MSRYDFSSAEDHQPVTWLAGRAIYGAHLIVIAFVASLLASSLLMAFGGADLFDWIIFTSSQVLKGEIWRVASYGLVNPPSLWFVMDMFMIVWFGRELEKFFGRRTFFILYGGLYLVTPLLFTAIGLIGLKWPLVLAGAPGALALFTAFATLYPNVPLCFGILAKWAAALLIGIHALIHLSSHSWPQLFALSTTTGFAHAFVRHAQGRLILSQLNPLRLRQRNRDKRVENPSQRTKAAPNSKEALMTEMDALLDRIAKSGISSLTSKERARLDAARESLIKHPKPPCR
jgi:hypothetical protein